MDRLSIRRALAVLVLVCFLGSSALPLVAQPAPEPRNRDISARIRRIPTTHTSTRSTRDPARPSDTESDSDTSDEEVRNGSNPAAAIGLGLLVAGLLASGSNKADVAKDLAKNGPQLPEQFQMGQVSVGGIVRGGWPLAIDLQLSEPALAFLEISVANQEPFFYRIDGSNLERQSIDIDLPARFGDKTEAAVVAVRAFRPETTGEMIPVDCRVFGIACGPRAVGSIGIDELSFGPETLSASEQGKAQYRFHSLFDFPKVAAEFLKLSRQGTGIKAERVKRHDVGSVRRDGWIGRDSPKSWDCKTDKKKLSQGLHILQVRAWRNSANEGDWVTAWSEESVLIEP